MRDLNDKMLGDDLPSDQWNEVPGEIQNAIEGTGIALSGSDLNQLGKAIANYVGGGDFYTDSGLADAYILSTVGLKQSPSVYANGVRVRFVAGNDNTGASTINVASLGVKSLKNSDGSSLAFGDILSGRAYEFRYDGTDFINSGTVPVYYVSEFGAAEQPADSTLAFQKWAAVLNATKGVGVVDTVATFYTISEPFILLSDIDVEGNNQTIKSIATNSDPFWMRTAIFIGTFFGGPSSSHFANEGRDPLTITPGVDAVNNQPHLRNDPYDIDDITAGTNGVTLQVGGDATDFSVGDVVMVRDPHYHTGDNMIAVTNVTRSGSTVTVTTSAVHGYPNGDRVLVHGAVETDYNGYKLITSVPTTTTFTYEITGAPTSPATGTITCDNMDIPYNIAEHLNEVISISGAVLKLKYVIKDSYTNTIGAGQSTETTGSVALYRESGTLVETNVPTSQTVSQGQGNGIAVLAKRSRIRNLNVEQDSGVTSQLIHVACYECDFENITVTGDTCMGINPCSYTNFNNIRINHRDRGLEFAYCHNDVSIDGLIQTRIENNGSGIINTVFSETGQDCVVTDFNVNGYTGGDTGVAALATSTRRIHFLDGVIGGSDGAGVSFAADNKAQHSSMKNVKILNRDTAGVSVNSDDIEIDGCEILGENATSAAVFFSPFVTRGKVTNNKMGRPGAYTSADFVYIPSGNKPDIIVEGNTNRNTRQRTVLNDETNHTGTTSLTTLHTHTIPMDTTPQKDWSMRIRAGGRISGTAAQKIVDISFAGVNIGKLTIPASNTGFWQFETTISKNGNATAYIHTVGTAEIESASDNKFVQATTNWTNTDIDIDIDATLSDVADNVYLNTFEVEYIGAEYNTIS